MSLRPRCRTDVTKRCSFREVGWSNTYGTRRVSTVTAGAHPSFQPSSRKLQVLQADEHTFYWGKPSPASTASASAPPTARSISASEASLPAEAPTPERSNTSSLAPSGQQTSILEPSSPISQAPKPEVITAEVPPGRLHAIIGAGSIGDLLTELEEALQEAGDEAPGPEARSSPAGDVGTPGAVILVLPPEVVDVALAKTAGWALDEGSFLGSPPDTVRTVLELLQYSLCVSRLQGYGLEEVGSMLWSLSSALRAYQWPPAAATLSTVQVWLADSETRGEVEAYGRFSSLVSALWGYAALLEVAAVGNTPQVLEVHGGSGLRQVGPYGNVRQYSGDANGKISAGVGLAEAKQEGRLDGVRPQDASAVAAAALDATLDALAARTATLMEMSYDAASPIDAVELTDLAWAIAVIERRSPAMAKLGEAVAHEVYRQLSNRYSLHTAFSPADLIKIVQAYSRMPLRDGSVSRMLDAIGGHVAKRIRNRHVQALTRPSDCAELLQAFTDTGHSSVVVPELFAACALQVTREVASHNEGLAKHVGSPPSSGGTPSSSAGTSTSAAARMRQPHTPDWRSRQMPSSQGAFYHWSYFLPLAQITRLLLSYVRAGYYPGAALLDSLLLAAAPQLPYSSARRVSDLLTLLATVRHLPGEQTLGLLAETALRSPPERPGSSSEQRPTSDLAEGGRDDGGNDDGDPGGAVARLRSLWAVMMMGWRPSEEVLDEVLSPVLLDDDLVLSLEDAGRMLSVLSILPLADCQPAATSGSTFVYVSTSAAASSAVSSPSSPAASPAPKLTIQRFGLACLKLRDSLADTERLGARRPVRQRQQLRQLRSEPAAEALLEEVLLAAGAAMVALGLEGWEMAEQVLPAAAFRQVDATVRRVLEHPYEGVDPSILADATRALADVTGVHGGVISFAVPIVDPAETHPCYRDGAEDATSSAGSAASSMAVTDAGATGSPGRPWCGEERGPGDDDDDDASEAPVFSPLLFRPVACRLPLGFRAAQGSGMSLQSLPVGAANAAASQGAGPQKEEKVKEEERVLVLDVCAAHDYGSNAAGQVLWGWARVRHALFSACGARRVVAVGERALASVQGSRQKVREQMEGALRQALAR